MRFNILIILVVTFVISSCHPSLKNNKDRNIYTYESEDVIFTYKNAGLQRWFDDINSSSRWSDYMLSQWNDGNWYLQFEINDYYEKRDYIKKDSYRTMKKIMERLEEEAGNYNSETEEYHACIDKIDSSMGAGHFIRTKVCYTTIGDFDVLYQITKQMYEPRDSLRFEELVNSFEIIRK